MSQTDPAVDPQVGAHGHAALPPARGWLLGVPQTVFLLGLVSFLTDVSSDMVYPLLPVFLSEVLRASPLAIGLIEGLAESTASVFNIFSGALSDRLRRRKLLIGWGYGLAAAMKPALGLAGAWWHVLGARFADRVGKGLRTAPRDALIADATAQATRGRSFGVHRAMDTAGAILGPLLALFLLPLLGGSYRALFWVAGIPGFVAVGIILFWVRESRPAPAGLAGRPRIGWRELRGPFGRFVFVATLFSVGNSSNAFLVLRARDIGVPVAAIPGLYLTTQVTATLLAVPAGALSDRLGRRVIICAGYLVFAAVYLGLALAGAPAVVWLLFVVYGFYQAFTEGVQRAFAADLSPRALRATAMGAYHMLTGLALLPASLIAGWLWRAMGPPGPFCYGGATALLASFGLLALVPARAREEG